MLKHRRHPICRVRAGDRLLADTLDIRTCLMSIGRVCLSGRERTAGNGACGANQGLVARCVALGHGSLVASPYQRADAPLVSQVLEVLPQGHVLMRG